MVQNWAHTLAVRPQELTMFDENKPFLTPELNNMAQFLAHIAMKFKTENVDAIILTRKEVEQLYPELLKKNE
jgi:hypothetical protein